MENIENMNMDNNNERELRRTQLQNEGIDLRRRMNDIIRDNTSSLESSPIPDNVTDKNIYLPSPHKLLKPNELEIGKSYYVIDITIPENVIHGQIEDRNGVFYSMGPFQNYGELKKIEGKNVRPGHDYTYYYFQYGNTVHYNDPNATYFYLYLDQETINKPIEIPPENIFNISYDAKNIPFYKTDVKRVAGKPWKSGKSKKSKKSRKSRKSRKTKH